MFFTNFCIPSTNLYSYTNPDFPFINHHWASGAVFYLVKAISGFKGLSIFFLGVSLLTFWLFFHIAWRYSNFEFAAFSSLLTIPLLVSRPETRPEIFSYLFCGLFFWLLWNCKNGRLNQKWLFLLPVLEVFWVNLHIYFFLGPLLIALFLFGHSPVNFVKRLFLVLGLSLLAALVNPSGIRGALYPLNIFGNYNLELVENQSFAVIDKLAKSGAFDFQPLFYFKLIFGIMALSWVFVLIKAARKKTKLQLPLFLASILFSAMAFFQIRNYAIFAYFAFMALALNLGCLMKAKFSSRRDYIVLSFLFIMIAFNLVLVKPSYWQREGDAGIGLKKNNAAAMDFFRKEGIKGPILNDYDIGGYLIYHLYPKERVFVDNRPEAYPADFFEKTYTALQQNEEAWRRMDGKFKFNTIIFYPHDSAPWAQEFLIRRVRDPLWAAVYVDDACVIFLKRGGPNQPVIRKYELPAEMFLPSG